MPTYEFVCPDCSREYEVTLTIKEKDESIIMCEDCKIDLHQHFRTPFMTNRPENLRSNSSSYFGKEPVIPINIIDYNEDGSGTVTRIGRKSDIDNE